MKTTASNLKRKFTKVEIPASLTTAGSRSTKLKKILANNKSIGQTAEKLKRIHGFI